VQFHIIINLDKQEFLDPEAFGDGKTLLEFARGSSLVLTALAWLCAEDNGKGDGDAPADSLVGTWARDRIVVAGDYGKVDPVLGVSLYERARETYTNVSAVAIQMLARDPQVRARFVDLGRGALLRGDQ
jgi:hypothetical protein